MLDLSDLEEIITGLMDQVSRMERVLKSNGIVEKLGASWSRPPCTSTAEVIRDES